MKTPILAGLAVGLATGAWMFAEYACGLHDDPAGAGRWTGFLALIFPVLGARRIAAKAPPRRWALVWRNGLVFGLTGGAVGGAAIYLYFALVNPGFSLGGRPVSAGGQAGMGFIGSLVLGTVLTALLHALSGRKGNSHAQAER